MPELEDDSPLRRHAAMADRAREMRGFRALAADAADSEKSWVREQAMLLSCELGRRGFP